MPQVMNVEELLKRHWPDFCDVEDQILKTIAPGDGKGCEFSQLPIYLGNASAMFGPADHAMTIGTHVVCTPVLQFQGWQMMKALKEAQAGLLNELKAQKPWKVGNLHVACSVNPSRMCYEMVLAVPFMPAS